MVVRKMVVHLLRIILAEISKYKIILRLFSAGLKVYATVN
jgi:hypothetical protein